MFVVDGGGVVGPGGGLAPYFLCAGLAFGVEESCAAVFTELFPQAEGEAAVVGVAEAQGLITSQREGGIDAIGVGFCVELVAGDETGKLFATCSDERLL